MDITNDDKNSFEFVPTYGYRSTAFHRHMISVFVFSYSNTLQITLANCPVTYMGCFGDYSDAVPRAKTMRVNDITTFTLHVAQCITFNNNKLLQQHLFPRHS